MLRQPENQLSGNTRSIRAFFRADENALMIQRFR